MTQGARSTEFWLVVAVILFGAWLCVSGLALGRDLVVLAGAGLVAVTTAGYAHSRGKTKSPRPYLPHSGSL